MAEVYLNVELTLACGHGVLAGQPDLRATQSYCPGCQQIQAIVKVNGDTWLRCT